MRFLPRLILLLLLLAMQVVDVGCTRRVAETASHEANPMVRVAVESVGWGGILAFKVALVLLLASYERSKNFDKWLWVAFVAYSLLTFYHIWLL
jgi:hypothetical protein